MLSDANRAALARVRAQALENRPRHLARIARVLEAAGAECGPGDLRGPVTLNFHPDRRLADGRSVAEVGDLQHMKYLWRLVVVYGEPADQLGGGPELREARHNDRKETPPMTGRVWLSCIIGAAFVAAAPAASAQAPAPPTKAQALSVAGDVAAGWAGALGAAGVDIEPCERTGAVRRCEVHVFDFDSDSAFDCHWWVRVRVASGDTLAYRTIRRTSDDSDCPSPLPAGPATTGQEIVPRHGRLGPA